MHALISRRFTLMLLCTLVIGALAASSHPFLTPTLAKGTFKTGTPQDDSSERKKDEDSKQPEKPKVSTPAARDESSDSRSNGSVVSPSQERRDNRQSAPSDRTTSYPVQRRDEGTPDLRGQIVKREEGRDPEYRFRKHYTDTFYHPYDREFWSSYPYYDRGAIIIISPERWRDRTQNWRRTYEYVRPRPASIEEALVDIEATWMERNIEFLMWHVDNTGGVDIYLDGKYSHTLSPRQIYKLTDEALQSTVTTSFQFTSVEKHASSARAAARHEYVGPGRRSQTVHLVYYLEKVRERWLIDRIDVRKRPYGSPSCFIATAAFGSPTERDVLTLRRFRDEHLLTNRPGRAFVAAYYHVSPPIAEMISESESARAVVRTLLTPVIQLCRLVDPAAAR